MQATKISTRLRLFRPGDTKAWPYSIDPNRVLVIFLPWLNAKEKHVSKYVQLYLDIGLDVLCLKSKIKDFLWPPTSFALAQELSEAKASGAQSKEKGGTKGGVKKWAYMISKKQSHREFGQKVLKQCKHYEHYLFHSMSIGSYNLTTFRILAKEDVHEVAELGKKVRGIIYDSIVIGAGKGGALENLGDGGKKDDGQAIDRFVRGMAKSVSQSRIVLSSVSLMSRIYFTLTKKQTLDYYGRAYDVARDEPAKVPTLVLASKNDPMCDKDVVKQMINIWKNYDVPVTLQMWDESGHAQHLAFHRLEYIDTQRHFLDKVFGSMDKDKGEMEATSKL